MRWLVLGCANIGVAAVIVLRWQIPALALVNVVAALMCIGVFALQMNEERPWQ